MRRMLGAVWGVLIVALPAVLAAQQPQNEFVPLDSLPKQEVAPAPLLYGAYAFVWGALALYVFVIWRRASRVERELAIVTKKLAHKA